LLVSRFEISSLSGGLTLTDTGSWSRSGGEGVRGESQAPSLPLSQVSLNFAVIEYEYKQQGPDGTLGPASRVKYNLKQMQAGEPGGARWGGKVTPQRKAGGGAPPRRPRPAATRPARDGGRHLHLTPTRDTLFVTFSGVGSPSDIGAGLAVSPGPAESWPCVP